MARTAMLFAGNEPHPVHRGFAESIGADIVNVPQLTASLPLDVLSGDNSILFPEYDTLISEGTGSIEAGVLNSHICGAELIFLAGGHGMYLLNNETPMNLNSRPKSLLTSLFSGGIRAVLRNSIDGVMAVSDLAAEITSEMVGDSTPTRIAHPYINTQLYDDLSSVEPSLGSRIAVTVSQASTYKGTDILVEAWRYVSNQFPDASLHIVGRGHPQEYEETRGVHVHGYVENIPDMFNRSALYVQPSRIDTFPVSSLEGMAAGLPTIATSSTGTASEIRKVDPELVTTPEAKSLSASVCRYFSMDRSRREAYSDEFREIGRSFDEQSRKKKFAKQYEGLLAEVRHR